MKPSVMKIPHPESRLGLCCDSTANIDHVPQLTRQDLRDKKFLDKGIFGHVWLVELVGGPLSLRDIDSQSSRDFDFRTQRNQQNPTFALKSINLSVPDPEEAAAQLTNEAKILSELDHENIIELRGVGTDILSGCFRSINYFLLLDVLDETLEDRLHTWGKKGTSIRRSLQKLILNDSDLRYKECQRMYKRISDTVLGIAKGLEYLHLKKIVWCDMKPANIGYRIDTDHEGISETTIKLIDFGMAAIVDNCREDESRGSLRYMAPEIMIGQRYTLEADVFSFGVLLAQICSLRVPYSKRVKAEKLSIDDFQHKVVIGELQPMEDLEDMIPCQKIQGLIQECLELPAKRPTCTDIVKRLTTIFDPSMELNNSCKTKVTYDSVKSLTELARSSTEIESN